jgi:serine protease AprX
MSKSRIRGVIIQALAVLLMLSAFRAPLGAQTLLEPAPLPLLEPAPLAPPAWLLAKVDPLLLEQLGNGTGQSYVIVRAESAYVVGLVSWMISALGGTLGHDLPILSARAARLPNSAVLMLAASPLVKRIVLDRLTFGFTERTSATVGADAVRQQLGYDGSGIGVAVIDSGITAWHNDLADLAAPATQRVNRFVDFVAGRTQPYDDYGHGTHVAGIIAGNGADSNGARSGIAPKARLVVLKVLDRKGRGRISDVIAAIDYAVAHKSEFGIRVINMSIGAGVYESYNTDLLTLAAKRAVEKGLVVVAAGGNHGRNDDGVVQHGAISAPGNAPWVITVGASSHMGTTTRADDSIATFSSRGPTAYDHAAKPDLVAPGVGIYSLSSPGSTLYDKWREYLLPGAVASPYMPYLSLSGTSQAAPVVAGTVALMLQANPSLTPNAVKAILQYTAEMYDGYSYLAQGAGFLNARGAVDLALAFNTAPAARSSASPEWSRQIIWGNHQVPGGELTATGNAWATRVAWGATTDANGALVTWGLSCSGMDCGIGGSGWTNWGASCSGITCDTIVWGSEHSVNVVWGDTCYNEDCADTLWATSDDDIIVWGNSESGIVVWGNSDADIVVWGNSDADIVVWGNSGEDPASGPVIWPE